MGETDSSLTRGPGASLLESRVAPGTDLAREAQIRRISYFMLFRLGMLLVFTLVAAIASWSRPLSLDPFYEGLTWTALGLSFALTLLFAWQLPRVERVNAVSWAQTITDIVLAAVVVQVTGGSDSGFVFLYLVAILGAAVSGDRQQTWAAAGACALIYLTMTTLQLSETVMPVAPPGTPLEKDPVEIWLTVLRNATAMTAITILSAFLNDQLQASAQEFRSLRVLNENIVQSLSSGLITVDEEGQIVFANPMAAQILEKPAETLEGVDIETLFAGAGTRLRESADGDVRFEVQVQTGPSQKSLGLSAGPLRDGEGKAMGHVVHFQDITQVRALEGELRRNERLAAVGGLAASIAHEVRNPLAAMAGCAELLTAADLADEDRRLLDVIRREAARLEDKVQELLAYTGRRQPQPVDLDLAAALEEIVVGFRADPAVGDLEVQVEFGDGATARVDPSMFSQILWNLLRNASEAGAKTIVVSIHTRDRMAQLSIEDDGPGIPAEVRERIFEPFFSTKESGSGFGLAIVHRIVQEHGGALQVDSEEGRGTTITVGLPLA